MVIKSPAKRKCFQQMLAAASSSPLVPVAWTGVAACRQGLCSIIVPPVVPSVVSDDTSAGEYVGTQPLCRKKVAASSNFVVRKRVSRHATTSSGLAARKFLGAVPSEETFAKKQPEFFLGHFSSAFCVFCASRSAGCYEMIVWAAGGCSGAGDGGIINKAVAAAAVVVVVVDAVSTVL